MSAPRDVAVREPAGPGLRARKKAQTRQVIQAQALRLFLANGYDATTVEEIATAAGVSHMTFFRHFPTKESVVDTDDYDPMIAELIASRPTAEDPLTAIHRAILEGLAAVLPEGRDALLTRTRLILATPALRARLWENQHATERLFTKALTARHPAAEPPDLEVRVLAAAALATLTTALITWVDGDGAEDLPELVDLAFAALRRHAGQG
ncbi:MAG: TetR/AcrR family transcriptional regulator [Pseudonocardiaceae bacterium]